MLHRGQEYIAVLVAQTAHNVVREGGAERLELVSSEVTIVDCACALDDIIEGSNELLFDMDGRCLLVVMLILLLKSYRAAETGESNVVRRTVYFRGSV
jgi:hypothetical protein